MFCPSCGKSISDESLFCMVCGKPIPGKQPPSSNPAQLPKRETPPVDIKVTGFWLTGDREVREPGFFGSKKIGRGFGLDICLTDASNQHTTADGELVIALAENYEGPTTVYENNPPEHEMKRLLLVFSQRVKVRRDEFQWVQGAQGYSDKRFLIYRFIHKQPLVFATAWINAPLYHGCVFPHIWFLLPDGKRLYKHPHERWAKWE